MTPAAHRWILAAFFALSALGFLVPWWPLSVAGLALMALWGGWFAAVLTGLLLDLAWGAPVGLSHFLYFPFALCAVLFSLVRIAAVKYFIDRGLPERL